MLDCHYQLSELRSPIPFSPVSKVDGMDASSFLSLPAIVGGNGGECWREESVQEVCNFHLRLIKWGSSPRKSAMLESDI